jgi:ABC-type transport system involved in cytochrome bd biosynthesis fused ATPase/permease subunit
MKELILLRGLPGSGKSTLATAIGGVHFEADMYFVDDNGNYNFEPARIKDAHAWCQNKVKLSMESGAERIVVSNTFTMDWEMEHYNMLANANGYRVHSVIVENRHGGVNEHDCPPDKIEIMRERFEIKL